MKANYMVMWIAELELMVSISCTPHHHSSEARMDERSGFTKFIWFWGYNWYPKSRSICASSLFLLISLIIAYQLCCYFFKYFSKLFFFCWCFLLFVWYFLSGSHITKIFHFFYILVSNLYFSLTANSCSFPLKIKWFYDSFPSADFGVCLFFFI